MNQTAPALRPRRRAHRGARPRVWVAVGCLVCLLSPWNSAGGQVVASPGQAPREVRMAFSQQLFREFNRTDGLAAAKGWLQTLSTRCTAFETNRVFLLDGLSALERAGRNHEFDLVMLLAVDYLKLEHRLPLTPWFTYRRGNPAWLELVLVTPVDGPASLAALRGKRLSVYGGEHAELITLWLETQLLEQGFTGLTEFFGGVVTDVKPTKLVLPVFFGQSDACVVTREAFELMGELNPQVRRRLAVRETSPPLLPVILCAHGQSDPELLRQMREALALAHEDVRAKQVLTAFRIEKMDPFDPALFEHVRRLIVRHDRLREAAAASAARSSASTGRESPSARPGP